MGMFDTLKSEYPLPGVPDEVLPTLEFQTKSLNRTLETLTIKADGRLVHDLSSYHRTAAKDEAIAQLEKIMAGQLPALSALENTTAQIPAHPSRLQRLSWLAKWSQLFQPTVDATDVLLPHTGIINFYYFPPSRKSRPQIDALEYYAYFKNGVLQAVIRSDPELDPDTSRAHLMASYQKGLLERGIPLSRASAVEAPAKRL